MAASNRDDAPMEVREEEIITSETVKEDQEAQADVMDVMDMQNAVPVTSHVESNGDEEDKARALNDRPRPSRRKRDPLSFDALMKEHDMMLIIRSILIIIAGLVLLIPMPVGFLAAKFMIFILLSYASIYNERMIGEEAAIRQDKHSKTAHIWSYVAFITTVLFFFWAALKAGMTMNSLSSALSDARAALTAAGLQAPIVR